MSRSERALGALAGGALTGAASVTAMDTLFELTSAEELSTFSVITLVSSLAYYSYISRGLKY